MRRWRYERFGGIAQLGWPRALVFVDRDRARALGHSDEKLWNDPARDGDLDGVLAAPLEAHLQLTNRCTAGCRGCYTGATPSGGPGEWGLDEWKRAVDALAAQGVFHLALGGGESATLPWLGELASHARARGLIPNLTTSGILSDTELARLVEIAPVFGQINVSIDGLGETYAKVRGFDGFARADAAVKLLRRSTKHVGLNCVVTRQNFEQLSDIFAYARRRKLNEVELLRFKPAGRGASSYELLRCTQAQHEALLPTILRLSRRHRVRVRLDCSYVPMIAHHRPGPELLRGLAVYGCAGGDLLVGAKAHGALTACSFAAAPPGGPTVDGIGAYWEAGDAFGAFRRWQTDAQAPCSTCEYHALCRGGCRVVSAHVEGSLGAPDPECPRVVAFAASHKRTHLPVLA